jgi:hypothetical protein
VSRFHDGGVIAGSTSVSMIVRLTSTTTSAALTGQAFGSITAYYLRQGGTPQSIALSALGSVNAAFSAGGWFELDSVHMPGLYRLDLPDAMWAAGVDFAQLSIACAGAEPFDPLFVLTGDVPQSGDGYALLNNPVETIAAGNLGTLNWTGIGRLIVALSIALANGGATGQINLRDQANLKNRISYTVDQNGNRTQMVVDLT